MQIYEELKARGLIAQVTDEPEIRELINSGNACEGRKVMCDYWGGMAEHGADTFWELYNPENPDESPYGGKAVNSYCHAWSCTPSYFLRKYFAEV